MAKMNFYHALKNKNVRKFCAKHEGVLNWYKIISLYYFCVKNFAKELWSYEYFIFENSHTETQTHTKN